MNRFCIKGKNYRVTDYRILRGKETKLLYTFICESTGKKYVDVLSTDIVDFLIGKKEFIR